MKKMLLAAAAAVTITAGAAGNADAANLNINGLDDGSVTFSWADFELGFTVDGGGGGSNGVSVLSDGVSLSFSGSWIDLGLSTPLSRTVYWVDPADGTTVTDIFSWTISTDGSFGTISGTFQDGGALGALPGGIAAGDIILKTADGSHNAFNFSAAFLTGQVLTEAVPLPAGLWLALTAFGGLGLIGRRRKALA